MKLRYSLIKLVIGLQGMLERSSTILMRCEMVSGNFRSVIQRLLIGAQLTSCGFSRRNGSMDKRHNLHSQAILIKKMKGNDRHYRKTSQHRYVHNSYYSCAFHAESGDLVADKGVMQARVYLKIRSGAIVFSKISISSDADSANAEIEMFEQVLKDKSIHDIDNFNNVLNRVEHDASVEVSSISRWLNTMFGKPS